MGVTNFSALPTKRTLLSHVMHISFLLKHLLYKSAILFYCNRQHITEFPFLSTYLSLSTVDPRERLFFFPVFPHGHFFGH